MPDGAPPPPITIRVGEERAPVSALSKLKSPKSIAFPFVAISTYSISLDGPSAAKIPRVDDAAAENPSIEPVKFPKSMASPSDANVIYRISSEEGFPPAINPLIDDEHAAQFLLSCVRSPKFCAFPRDEIVI